MPTMNATVPMPTWPPRAMPATITSASSAVRTTLTE
jgi:hypothetical protein